MHQKFIVHRDLKLDNVLIKSLDENRIEIAVADFGLADWVSPKVSEKLYN